MPDKILPIPMDTDRLEVIDRKINDIPSLVEKG